MTTMNKDKQAAMTPKDALAALKDGNRRFLAGTRLNRDLLEQVELTSKGQAPFAVVLGCIDSRVPSEHVFDQGIGDIFNARVAGNVINEDILGSMEFACKVAGSKLVVVLGHTRCGAVMGACDGVELGNLTPMLAKIKPAVESVREPADAAARNSKNPEFVEDVGLRNVELGLQAIRTRSPILREMEENGEIAIVGARYHVATGEVEFLDS